MSTSNNPTASQPDWSELHSAAQRGDISAVKLLLEQGANPNAREAGDNTFPLHWAAAAGHREVVQALLDAGGDVHGLGDLHELDVIGWATVFGTDGGSKDAVSLLVERGARHHIFSAIAVGDLGLIRRVVEQDPRALDRRLSRFENGQTPLHFALTRKRHDVLGLLLDLGADIEAQDRTGQTALEVAMVRGDRDAVNQLLAAGAQRPRMIDARSTAASVAAMATSIKKGVPMLAVPDVAATLDWYVSLGFTELTRYEDGVVSFGMLAFGNSELMLTANGRSGPHDVSLWFYTDQIDRVYQTLKNRQLASAQAMLIGEPANGDTLDFVEELYEPFYGGRQFGIRDPNGYTLYFLQPDAS